jgi:DNA modification methylase
MRSHEMIYVFSKAGAFYRRIDENNKCVLSVIQQCGKKSRHPTEKPKDLYKWLIERYCPPGGTVLDPTFGSGNSVFTAYELGRNAIGIEKDEKFYKKAKDLLPVLEA